MREFVLVDWGHNFHFSKSQKKFRPADRNSELAKPNMYFAAALITFAAKTPTVNERRPMRSSTIFLSFFENADS